MTPALTPQQAIAALWRAGDLSYLLHETQERMRDNLLSSDAEIYVINCARRLGKSYLACIIAVEQCLQLPGSQVRYAAPTGKAVRKIVTPNMRKVLASAPAECRPEFNSMDGVWRFPNGSEIHVAGVNNGHADDLRGVESHLAIVDEAGFVGRGMSATATNAATDDESADELEYLVESVLEPQLLTTGGRIILLSTPPVTPAHSFVGYCAKAADAGAYSHFTLYDAKHIPRERIDRFIAKAGGITASKVRREYLAEFVIDTSRAVLPEFSLNKASIVEERERPAYFVPIIVADIGYHDHSFAGFGYHDFLAGVDVIEGEYVTEKTLARDIDAECSKIALELWGVTKANEAMRFADAPAQVIAELNGEEKRTGQRWSGIAKTQTDGTFLTAATNDLRTRLSSKPSTVRVHPRCTSLIAHASNALWRIPGRDYQRMAGYGHFDGAAMLTYFARLVDRQTNPSPRRAPGVTSADHWLEPSPDVDLERALAGRWQQPRGAARR